MLSKRIFNLKRYALAGACLLPLAFSVQAKELPAGTVISASNYEQIANDTFEGHKIADMLTPAMKLQVVKYGMDMPLEHSDPKDIQFSKAWSEAEQANAGKYTLNAKHEISEESYFKDGRGAPFPMDKINASDPEAGWKLVWNYWFSNPNNLNDWEAIGNEVMVRKDQGIINRVQAINAIMHMESRIGGTPRVGHSSQDHANFLLVLTKPYDLAGIGVFNHQYNDGTASDGYVYLRSIRRTRRTAGGRSWVDPQPQADLLNDDSQGLQGYPAWYKSWKLIGEKYVLVAVDMPDDNYGNTGPVNGQYLDINHVPHWNYINTKWQPRKVFVLEGIPPDYHPYGKKILYEDYKYPFFYYGEFYDKNMKLWKLWHTRFAPYWNGGCDGEPGLENFNTLAIDFKAERATYIKQGFNMHNCVGLDIMRPEVLQDAASGALMTKFKELEKQYKQRKPLPQYKAIEDAWLAKHGDN